MDYLIKFIVLTERLFILFANCQFYDDNLTENIQVISMVVQVCQYIGLATWADDEINVQIQSNVTSCCKATYFNVATS